MNNQNLTQPKKDNALRDQMALLSFVEDLIKERKDPDVNEKNIANVRALLLKEVNEAINTHLVSLLTERDQIELDVLLEKKMTNEQLDDFFHKKIPNLEVEIASSLLNFRAAYLYPLANQTPAAEPPRLDTINNDRTSEINQPKTSSSLPPAPPVAPAPVKNLPS